MLQTLPALFISSLRGLTLRCPGESACSSSASSRFRQNMFGFCPETKHCAGMRDREGINPERDRRKATAKSPKRGRKDDSFLKPLSWTYLPVPSGEPCWPRYFQSPLSECESRAVAIHFTQRKKDGFSDQTCRRRWGCCTRARRTLRWRIVGVLIVVVVPLHCKMCYQTLPTQLYGYDGAC